MIITYFKQAWQLLKQNKLFSTIYIIGTALAIASTTIFAIIYYVRLAPVYPEYKRGQIYSLSMLDYTDGGYTMSAPGVSQGALNSFFKKVENADVVSAYRDEYNLITVSHESKPEIFEAILRYSDTDYFKIFDYDFIAGAPFSDNDFESRVRKIAISDQVARQFFESPESAIGQTLSVNFTDYDVCGVFRDGSAINSLSFVHIIAPYTIDSFASYTASENENAGALKLLFLSDNGAGLKAEVDDFSRRYTAISCGEEMQFFDQPRAAWLEALSPDPEEDFDLGKALRYNILILLTLLIVPALNLSGMIAGRLDSRREELGVRKSFGARRGILMGQILWENMMLTVIGGIIGFAITAITLSTDAVSIFASIGDIPTKPTYSSLDIRITQDMIFAPTIFVFAFLLCVVLNIMSALIPAYNALRKPIVKSLK